MSSHRLDFGRLAFLPFDDPAAEPLLARLPEAARFESVHLFRPDGSVWSPSSAPYRLVARNRRSPAAGRARALEACVDQHNRPPLVRGR